MDRANIGEGAARRARVLRIHFIAYSSVNIVLFATDLLFSEARWFYWPAMAWGAVLGAHWLFCKSLAVDDDWAERRANKIRDKSYDLGHIRDIENTFNESQAAEKSAAERKR